MKVVELKKYQRKLKLSTSGIKAVLRERLMVAIIVDPEDTIEVSDDVLKDVVINERETYSRIKHQSVTIFQRCRRLQVEMFIVFISRTRNSEKSQVFAHMHKQSYITPRICKKQGNCSETWKELRISLVDEFERIINSK